MKIKGLNINAYRHLENVNFDFTYPEGHEKAGKPLEKICIIGQSATGKTSVLELLKENVSKFNDVYIGERNAFIYDFTFNGTIGFLYDNDSFIISEDKLVKNEIEYEKLIARNGRAGDVEKLVRQNLRLMYFSSEIIAKEVINIFNQNPIDINDKISNQKEKSAISEKDYVYEFSSNIDVNIWLLLLTKILKYRKLFTQMASELINKGVLGDAAKLSKDYSKWATENKNPLVEFAESFDPILLKLNLQIDLVNTEYPIPIKSKINDEVIPFSGLSTGTKGLLLSLFPLFELDTTDAIILVDEPERSLFPDMQIELINRYRAIAPDAQLIVATHSPFIAAAFEPEERFILYFDDNGKVAVRRGESPIGDDPNDILSNDFKVDYYNQFGKDAYRNYRDLKRDAAQEKDTERKKKLIVEAAKLGDKYNFE